MPANVFDEKFPRRRCTCGYRKFSVRPATGSESVQRYVLFDTGRWGLFEARLQTCSTALSCASCTRPRSREEKSSIAVFGFYTESGKLYVVASDVDDTSCFSVTAQGPQGQYNLNLTRSSDDLQPLNLVDPGEDFSSPQGPAADDLLEASLPVITVGGSYTVRLNNTCCSSVRTLGSVELSPSGDGYGAVAYGTKQGG